MLIENVLHKQIRAADHKTRCTDCALVALSGYCPVKGGGSTVSELDLPSLTPLSLAGCGRLQLEAAHWATWVTLLQVVDN